MTAQLRSDLDFSQTTALIEITLACPNTQCVGHRTVLKFGPHDSGIVVWRTRVRLVVRSLCRREGLPLLPRDRPNSRVAVGVEEMMDEPSGRAGTMNITASDSRLSIGSECVRLCMLIAFRLSASLPLSLSVLCVRCSTDAMAEGKSSSVQFKVVLLGEGRVGKTCVCLRYVVRCLCTSPRPRRPIA
jgi:hypothetical protein